LVEGRSGREAVEKRDGQVVVTEVGRTEESEEETGSWFASHSTPHIRL
jgi:hypothetical protein